MEDPLVSIIVPVYNTESFIDTCLTSIRNQTYKNIQIILVNDGSTDSSPEICSRHAEDDSRIMVLHKYNGGVSSARNAGLDVSTGTYIMFVDSDDRIESNAVETLVNVQKTYDFDVIVFGYCMEYNSKNETIRICSPSQSYYSKEQLMPLAARMIEDGRMHPIWNKFYKASILKRLNICFEEQLNLAEDVLFNYHVIFEIESLHITDRCFYHYTIRGESLDHRFNPAKYNMLSYVNDWLQEKIKYDPYYSVIKCSADHIRFKNTYSCIFDLFRNGCSLTYKEKMMFLQSLVQREGNFPYQFNNRIYRILLLILRTKRPSIIYIAAYLVHKIRQVLKNTGFAAEQAGR
ncbi:MAG TPA: glycosyltransferase [Clostridiales bacterium]|nr:glycosyltransferase [Clostridiales bacterium]